MSDAAQTPEEVVRAEQEWLDTVYHHDREPELTVRVVGLSILIAGLVVAFNLYMSLKSGIRAGGSIVAVVLAYTLARAVGQRISPLENNLTQTAASAAASLGSIVNVIPALILLAADGVLPHAPSFTDILLWVLATSFIGVFFAVPLRRQAIVIDKLTFPTGVAAAQTIRAVHAQGSDAVARARTLGWAGLAAAVVTWFRDGLGSFLPGALTLPSGLKIGGIGAGSLTAGVAVSPMMLGVGVIVGPRIGLSMLAAGAVGWLIIVPILVDQGVLSVIAEALTPAELVAPCREVLAIAQPSEEQLAFAKSSCKQLRNLHRGAYYSLVVRWTLWPALGLMLGASLSALAMRWRLVTASLRSMLRRDPGERPLAHLEIPRWQWLGGLTLGSLAALILLQWRFGVAWYLGLFALLLSFVLAIIAVRATGETDINPSGPMGSVTQVIFGAGQTQLGLGAGTAPIITGNLMTGGIAASAASEAGDMMQDLKTGWLLGATPRRQVYAQLLGVFVGGLLAAPIFWLLIQANPVGSAGLPAPSALTWSGLATMMARGSAALPPGATAALLVGAGLGVLLAVAERLRPELARRALPSAIGMGVALIIPLFYSAVIAAGAAGLLVLRRRLPTWAADHAIVLGAGLIAGEGLCAILAELVNLLF